MKTIKVYTQYEENKEWMSKLLLWKDEIKVMENRLAEVVSKNTSKELLAKAEHFQNRIFIQKNTIDSLKHEINLSNDSIKKEAGKNITALDHRNIEDNSEVRENIEMLEKLFTSMKRELNLFLSERL